MKYVRRWGMGRRSSSAQTLLHQSRRNQNSSATYVPTFSFMIVLKLYCWRFAVDDKWSKLLCGIRSEQEGCNEGGRGKGTYDVGHRVKMKRRKEWSHARAVGMTRVSCLGLFLRYFQRIKPTRWQLMQLWGFDTDIIEAIEFFGMSLLINERLLRYFHTDLQIKLTSVRHTLSRLSRGDFARQRDCVNL